ncbi:hypothetical protein [Bosea sp. (in: a-proteobacteria)]|uniref:hypothetical protein n=1 Tax=Bosea sp. (in: a-proteobacteria) TaxID=1871050 RepID=UPI003F72F678
MEAATILVALGPAWLLAGLAVGVAFLLFGLDRVDAAARGAYGFRPLLLPGLVLLWPLVIWRWLEALAPASVPCVPPSLRRRHKRAHAVLWLGLAGLLPLVLATALALRQHDLPAPASLRIDAGAREAEE